MKRQNYAGWLLVAVCAVFALPVLAQVTNTNTVPTTLPPLPKSVADYWDLAIGAVSPMIIWGLAKVMPKIPRPFLPVLTPVVGIGVGALVNWLAGQNLTWFEMAKAGALAVFFREVVNQWVTKRMTEPDFPAAPLPPAVKTG
jgi:MFS superfamily sulfate permease-like transporter